MTRLTRKQEQAIDDAEALKKVGYIAAVKEAMLRMPTVERRLLYKMQFFRALTVGEYNDAYNEAEKEIAMSNPINEVEDALFVIGRGMEELKRQTFLQLQNLDAAVFDQAWKLAARRESDGTCPCCGNMRATSSMAKRGAMA